MSDFIYTYYKLGLFLLSAIKSESFLLYLIIFVSDVGLDFYHVFFYILLGSLFYNNIIFILGRYCLKSTMLKILLSHEVMSKISNILLKNKRFFIIFYRFINGFKLISPFFLNRYISFFEFFILNAIGDIIWSMIFLFFGYLLIFYNIRLTNSLIFLMYCMNFAISSVFYYLVYRFYIK